MKIKGQIIVAERVIFDKDNATHSIENIKNSTYFKLFPSVVICDLFIKIFHIHPCDQKITLIVKGAEDGFLFYRSFVFNGKNTRREEMIPGIDISIPVRFTVAEQGNYYFKLFINDETIHEYPLYVGLNKSL